jgi:hypothetical protein
VRLRVGAGGCTEARHLRFRQRRGSPLVEERARNTVPPTAGNRRHSQCCS